MPPGASPPAHEACPPPRVGTDRFRACVVGGACGAADDSGVLVCEQGMGSVVDNEIFANFMAGVAIGHGGASTVKGNMIRDGSGGSLLCLSTQSRGLICANVIDQDASATLQARLRAPPCP